MYYFVTYNKKTKTITGSFSQTSDEFIPEPPTPEEAILQITDKEQIETLVSLNPWQHSVEGKVRDDKIESLTRKPRFQGKLLLTTDAEDKDGDGFPELPADGSTAVKVRAAITDLQGNTIKDRTVPVKFRVSRGAISSRQAETKNGIAEVEFTAVAETTQARIMATAPGFEMGTLIVEFIPTTEFETLQKPKGRARKRNS